MGDDVGRENDRRAARGLAPDQFLKLALIDRVEAGEGLIEHDQLRFMNDRPQELDGLGHALREIADRLLRPVAKAVAVEQLDRAAAALAKRKPAQCAHECDRVHRGHPRIQSALLGEVADLFRRIQWTLMTEQAARA